VRDGAFHHEAGKALVFGVTPTRVLSYGRKRARRKFSATRYRF
jgi:hypothetical protein